MASSNIAESSIEPEVSPEVRRIGHKLAIGTRKSKLALAQTDLVIKALEKVWAGCDFQVKASDAAAGDIDKITPFKDMPVKNIWTHELETLMIEGKLDILVHSLKDVPTQLPPNCDIFCVLAREDPRDAFVLKAGRPPCNLSELAPGSVVGTSSIRRTAQLALKHPHLRVQDVRGNVPTRLSKLDAEDGPFDAIIVAAAGLKRLGLADRVTQILDSTNGGMLHAVGQGAIGVESRTSDVDVVKILSEINDKRSYLACLVERSLLRYVEGGCSAPLGVETKWSVSEFGVWHLRLRAIVVSVDGQQSAEMTMMEVVDTKDGAEAFGIKAAKVLLQNGADKILAQIKAKKPTQVSDLLET